MGYDCLQDINNEICEINLKIGTIKIERNKWQQMIAGCAVVALVGSYEAVTVSSMSTGVVALCSVLMSGLAVAMQYHQKERLSEQYSIKNLLELETERYPVNLLTASDLQARFEQIEKISLDWKSTQTCTMLTGAGWAGFASFFAYVSAKDPGVVPFGAATISMIQLIEALSVTIQYQRAIRELKEAKQVLEEHLLMKESGTVKKIGK